MAWVSDMREVRKRRAVVREVVDVEEGILGVAVVWLGVGGINELKSKFYLTL